MSVIEDRTHKYLEEIENINPFENNKSIRDIDMAQWFGELIQDVIAFNIDDNQFWYYNGCCWVLDKGKKEIECQADYFGNAINEYCHRLRKSLTPKGQKPPKELDDYIKSINRLGSYKNRMTLIKDVQHHIGVKYEDFDSNKYLINCQNGTYDIQNKVFRKHDSKDFITRMTPIVYDPDAISDDWDRFIHEVMEDDQLKVNYLQKLFGYCLTGSTTEGQMYILYGQSTRNGKSTMTETISYILGNNNGYSANAQPDLIAKKKVDSRRPSEDVARLKGVRAVFIGEPDKGMVLNCAMVKQLVGEDMVTARKMYGHDFEFKPECKLIMHTNHLPEFYDQSLIYGNKIVVISFNRHFSEDEQDHTLKDRLRSEYNVAGIFNWMLKGLEMYQSDGLKQPDSIRCDTKEYGSVSDTVGNFINEMLIEKDGATANGTEVYITYKKYCQSNGLTASSNRIFYNDLKSHGIIIDEGKVNGSYCRNRINGYMIENSLYLD